MHLTSTTLNESLRDALAWLLKGGQHIDSRDGGTLEVVMATLRITQPWHREVTLPNRKASLPAQIFETAWVLAGRNDIESLGRYLPRARNFSDDGKTWRAAYGPRIQQQIPYIVQTLTEQSFSRQAVISIYDPEVDSTLAPVRDRACNLALQFLVRDGALHCNVFLRSNDAIWGYSGINVFEWSTLQEIIAGLLGLKMGHLQFNTSSFHLYDRHIARAEKIVGAPLPDPNPVPSPRFHAGAVKSVHGLPEMLSRWFQLEQMIRETPDDFPGLRDEISAFPEPMFRSWLRVLAHHWSGDPRHLWDLNGTPLKEAALLSPERKRPQPERSNPMARFAEEVTTLHSQKHAAYGDSWKRRGELLGILANVDRKIDRLEANDELESSLDTAVDLFVYSTKWLHWIADPDDDGDKAVNRLLFDFASRRYPDWSEGGLVERIRALGGRLDALVPDEQHTTADIVELTRKSAALARIRWERARGDNYGGADRD